MHCIALEIKINVYNKKNTYQYNRVFLFSLVKFLPAFIVLDLALLLLTAHAQRKTLNKISANSIFPPPPQTPRGFFLVNLYNTKISFLLLNFFRSIINKKITLKKNILATSGVGLGLTAWFTSTREKQQQIRQKPN